MINMAIKNVLGFQCYSSPLQLKKRGFDQSIFFLTLDIKISFISFLISVVVTKTIYMKTAPK